MAAEKGAEVSFLFRFESGDHCAVCGKYHADQWHCDPAIANPWGATDEDDEES